MPNFRRLFVPGGTYFFTVVTHRRRPILCERRGRRALINAARRCRNRWPFEVIAFILIPDHIHVLCALPCGDAAYPRRIGWIKKEFTKAWLAVGGTEAVQSEGRRRDGRRGIWQAKYWEHTIRDEGDLEQHFDYIHFNGVKHGLAARPSDWPYSSFHRWMQAGVYGADWALQEVPSTVRAVDGRIPE